MTIEVWNMDWLVGEYTTFAELYDALFRDNMLYTDIILVEGGNAIHIGKGEISQGA